MLLSRQEVLNKGLSFYEQYLCIRKTKWGSGVAPYNLVGWRRSRAEWRRSRVVTFTAIRLRGPGFKPRPGQKFENENVCFSFQAHPSGGEGVSCTHAG